MPVTLPISGWYDRLGSIDMIEENRNCKLIFEYFKKQLDSKNIEVDMDGLLFDEFQEIEEVLRATERSTTMEYDCIKVNGKRWAHTLICSDIWNALSKNTDESSDLHDKFNRFFPSNSSKSIYSESIEDLEREIEEFTSAMKFLAKAGIKLSLPSEPFQHYSEELAEYIEEARKRFVGSPKVLAVIDKYENDNMDLLDDDD